MYMKAAADNKQPKHWTAFLVHSASECELKEELHELENAALLPSTGFYMHCTHSGKYST